MEKRNTFTGGIGFVLAAAGSAVGLGNIWRFPYLAARDGGGLFLLIYIALVFTFGFTLLTSEIAIGRKTKSSPSMAYGKIHKKWGWLGGMGTIIPAMILPYYSVIGGWVLKYLVAFAAGDVASSASDGYFVNFITSDKEPIVFGALFFMICAFVVFRGVESGIEAMSKVLMPILFCLIVVIGLFSLTISHTDAEGVTRTGLEGLKILTIPDLSGLTLGKVLRTTVDAMGQLFYSLSVAMGIMVTYGSYVKREQNLPQAINMIEIFDTLASFLAGMMIIPAVYAFAGSDGLNSSGPSLIFVALPKIFLEMGDMGRMVGIAFFAIVLFAAVTSAVSLLETIVSSLMDATHISRTKADILVSAYSFVVEMIVCFGYNLLYFELTLPNGSVGQVLDVLDYASNNIMMPLMAIGSCILIGWVVGPKFVVEEIERGEDHHMNRQRLYYVMVRYIAPILLLILMIQSLGLLDPLVRLVRGY